MLKYITDYRQFKEEFSARDQALITAQEANTANIAALAEATKGLVIAWDSVIAFQKFIKWVASFAFLGASLLGVLHNLPELIKLAQ